MAIKAWVIVDPNGRPLSTGASAGRLASCVSFVSEEHAWYNAGIQLGAGGADEEWITGMKERGWSCVVLEGG